MPTWEMLTDLLTYRPSTLLVLAVKWAICHQYFFRRFFWRFASRHTARHNFYRVTLSIVETSSTRCFYLKCWMAVSSSFIGYLNSSTLPIFLFCENYFYLLNLIKTIPTFAYLFLYCFAGWFYYNRFFFYLSINIFRALLFLFCPSFLPSIFSFLLSFFLLFLSSCAEWMSMHIFTLVRANMLRSDCVMAFRFFFLSHQTFSLRW